jgi:hypothetical protein
MLQNRARSWACRDAFPDVLRGLIAYEEAIDIPRGEQNWPGPTIDATPTPPGNVQPSAPDHPKAEVYAPPAPPAPARRTARQWLDELRLRVAQCQTTEELDQIATGDDVRKAQQHLKNGALEDLNAIMADAMERLREVSPEPAEPIEAPSEPMDDVFPGDLPLHPSQPAHA